MVLLSSFPPPCLPGPTQINQVVSYSNQPLLITTHDDRGIRVLDSQTGKSVHSMVAYLHVVT